MESTERLGLGQTMCRLQMPILGIKIPKMSRKPSRTPDRQRTAGSRDSNGGSGLADALFSRTQQRVLGLLFGQPERSFFTSEVIERAGVGSGAVQRELARLERVGLAETRRVGTQKHYQANPRSPLYEELCAIARKTFGLAGPLNDALEALAPRIRAAFVFGSVARREDTAASDIDLMIVSDSISHADAYAALEQASQRLGRTVNATVYTTGDLMRRRGERNAFVTRVLAQPKLFVIGDEDELRA